MEISKVEYLGGWKTALNVARQTAHKYPLDKEPSDEWKRNLLRAEHSPIRCVQFSITFADLPYYVSTHLVRHFMGVEKFVSTQRTDRTGIDRNKLPQDAPVKMTMITNAQALINISRKRLCGKASPETKKAWQMAKDEIAKIDKPVADAMVCECVYRGFCPEMQCCGFVNSDKFKLLRDAYCKK